MVKALVPVLVCLILLVVLAGLAYYLYQRWVLQNRQRQLLAWAGRHIPYRAMEEGEGTPSKALLGPARERAVTATAPEARDFEEYVNNTHHFRVVVPNGWEKYEGGPEDAIVVQFVCPTDYISDGMRNGTVGAHCNLGCTFSLSVQGEEASYKRFSVAWDDVSWAPISARRFVQNMARTLPRMVPNARVESNGPAAGLSESEGWELVYSVESPAEDGTTVRLRTLSVVRMSGVGRRSERDSHYKAFTVSFGVDERAFQAALPLANHLLSSFSLLPEARTARAPPDTRPPHGVSFGSELESAWMSRVSFASGGDSYSALSPDPAGPSQPRSHVSPRGFISAAASATGRGSVVGSPRATDGERLRSNGSGTSAFTPVAPPGGPPPRPNWGSGSAVSVAADTPPNPRAVNWRDDIWPAAGLRVVVPEEWRLQSETESQDALRMWMRLYSSDVEETGRKQLRVVVMDLSAARGADPSAELLPQLIEYYREEVRSHENWRITAERPHEASYVFRVECFRGREEVTSASWVGLHRGSAGGILGHVATFTARRSVFPSYERFAQHIFRRLEGLGSAETS